MPTPCEVDTTFRLDTQQAEDLARQFGTPLYVLTETCLRQRIRAYKHAFEASAERTQLCYASKANSTLGVIKIAHEEGCRIDVASEGELRAAIAAGVPAGDCEFHGSNKHPDELLFALESGIHAINVDNFEEIEHLSSLWQLRYTTKLVLRLAPGVDPITHEKIATGQEDSKFGFNISDGSAERAVLLTMKFKLHLVGFHCHVGSQLLDPEAQAAGAEALARFALRMLESHGFEAQVLNFGGGLGIPYTKDDSPLPVIEYCRRLADGVSNVLGETSLKPLLMQEPGRALVGEAGLTLYQVGVVKEVPVAGGTRVYVSVDGGLADNPRPALYGAEYTVERVSPVTESGLKRCTVSGRHCETDELFPNVLLPNDIAQGDLLQVLCTGAYNSSMASNYNRYPRPATVLLTTEGTTRLLQRQETWDEMFAREIV
jgi:diaminopimelate decarboxylase